MAVLFSLSCMYINIIYNVYIYILYIAYNIYIYGIPMYNIYIREVRQEKKAMTSEHRTQAVIIDKRVQMFGHDYK